MFQAGIGMCHVLEERDGITETEWVPVAVIWRRGTVKESSRGRHVPPYVMKGLLIPLKCCCLSLEQTGGREGVNTPFSLLHTSLTLFTLLPHGLTL